jgi:uncharacterized protein (TIRG00374 family)
MNAKKVIITLIQVTVTIALLWWLFHDQNKREQMASALKTANYLWFIPGFISFGLVLFCAAIRWRMLMMAQGIRLSLVRVWQLVMIGMFYNLFLPGGTGGDLVKVFYAMKEAPKRKSAVFLSVVVDRVAGMVALIFVSAGVFLWFRETLMSLPIVRAFLLTVVIIFALFLGLILMAVVIDRFHLANRLPEKMPGYTAIVEMARAFSVYARDWKVIAAAILISMPLNLFIFGTGIFTAFAFPGNPGAAAMTSVIPIVNTISSIPISVSGIGLREGLFKEMLNTLYHTDGSLAVVISITAFALGVLWGLIGGVITVFYRPSDGSSISSLGIEGEIGAIEHQIENEERAS